MQQTVLSCSSDPLCLLHLPASVHTFPGISPHPDPHFLFHPLLSALCDPGLALPSSLIDSPSPRDKWTSFYFLCFSTALSPYHMYLFLGRGGRIMTVIQMVMFIDFVYAYVKETNPECSFGGLMLNWNSSTLATWCWEPIHWKRPWCWERLRAGEEGGDRGSNG